MTMRAGAAAAASLLLLAASAIAQPAGGVLRVRLENGTTGGPGDAEQVTLFRLEGGMVPAKELSDVTGSFEIRDIQVEGQRPMLLQVTHQDVNYNQPVNFGRGYEADVTVTVYDVTSSWSAADMQVQEVRYLYRRQGGSFLVDGIFIVQNRSSPPVTYYDPEGSFRLALPSAGLEQLNSISARGQSGMPVPQQASPLPGGTGYSTKTAFKPGETTVSVSYQVSYAGDSYAVSERVFYDVPELYVFVSPADVQIDAAGWENLGREPEGRYVAIRKTDVTPETELAFELEGGSATSAIDVTGSSSSGGASESSANANATVETVPDPTLSTKWVLVVLMAAALGYGLLSALYSRPESRGDR